MSAGLHVERAGGVVLLRIERPAAKNALSFATLESIGAAATDIRAAGADVRAVVLAGSGGTFASGGDLRELAQVVTEEGALEFAALGSRTCEALSALDVPVIAAVTGGAYGGGAELALACDIRVGDATSVFGFRQARMGVTTAWGTLAKLVALAGPGRASRLLFAAADIGSAEAYTWGLLDELAPSAEEGARALATTIAAVSAGAVREQKRLVRGLGERGSDESGPRRYPAADGERAAFARTWMAADHAEAMRAFAERRPPVFR